MAAANTDKLKKIAKRWVGQIGAGGVSDEIVTTIPLSSTTNLPNDTAVNVVIDRVDANGTATPTLEEEITAVVSGSNLIDAVRGVSGTAQAHSAGAVVEVLWTEDIWNSAVNHLLVEHNQNGTHKTDVVTTLKATGAEINTGTEDAKIVTPKAIADSWLNNGYNSIYRQAIINGNFDVWQRGTSVTTPTDGTLYFLADRWFDIKDDDGGTSPTLTRSRQLLTSGDIFGSLYYTRLTTNGAGTSLGNSSYHAYRQKIEGGTRFLCGDGKKVTVSFYARSSIANKRICPTLVQNYGTGGSPSTIEQIKGTPITLTSSWVKYTTTFTTNTLVGKTFGTDINDYLQLNFYIMWGTTIGNTNVQTGVTAETYVGSGTIDIAQVQLCAGDVALPFQPKSFEEELRACQRYYEKSYRYIDPPGTSQSGNETGLATGIGHANNIIACSINFNTRKRSSPTVSVYKFAGTVDKISNFNANDEVGTFVICNMANEMGIWRLIDSGTGFTAGNRYWFCWVANAEL